MLAIPVSIAFLVISLVTFCFYGADKRRAKKGQWRIPEKVLLGMSFFGGALGGCLAMKLLRHKTKHWYFVVINAIGLLWQVAAVAYLALM